MKWKCAMMINEVINKSHQALLEEMPKSRLILLHPNSRYRSVLIAKLINDPQLHTLYYAMGPDDTNLKAFIENLVHDFGNQHPTFGRHLNMLSQEVYAKFDDNIDLILDTFVKELNEANGAKPLLLILDEYDRSDDADDIHRFVEGLADHMPPNTNVLINSRSLPRLPWVAMIAKREAGMLLDDKPIVSDFYQNQRENQPNRLEVFALGQGNVILDGKQVETWEGHLPRLLFFFTLDRPLVTRSEICHAFWPMLESDQAVNVFHVTKRRLHKALGLDVLVHNETHYSVNPAISVYYDVLDFVETLMRGRDPNNKKRFEAYQQAAKLYRGPFLQGHNEPWIDSRRHAFRIAYLEALTEMANDYIARNSQDQALKLYQQAIDEDYNREDLHRGLMKLYTDMGRRPEAVAHFQQLEKAFIAQRMTMSPETIKLFNEIKA
jgi:DNA-binding SARP family transcriptional activator